MATKAKTRDLFNDFLDRNQSINRTSDLKESIKKYKKGHIPYLLGILVLGSVITLLLSFTASVIGYGNPTTYFYITLLTNFTAVVINNIIFACFLKRSKEEKISAEDVTVFLKSIVTQIICSLILSIAQSFITIMLLQITSISPTLNVMSSIITSVIFTLLNALVAFRICDGKKRMKEILPGAWSILVRNWKPLVFICLLFVTWSYVSNVAFTNMLYTHIQETQGANNIFHALLQTRDYVNLAKVAGFYGMNYLIAGFLEIDVLLGLAMLYQKDRKVCFREK